jgi:tannase/feruloyl esterase
VRPDYPDEFDGIIAGDPANMRRNAWALWLAVQTFKDPAAVIPPEKCPAIHRAVLDACDANDGLRDGLIDDPASCRVDFKTLECAGADGPDCLTPRQVLTAQTITSPATAAGQVVFPRLEPGTELRWNRLAGGPAPADIFVDQFRYVVYQDPGWDWRSFHLERDSARANDVDKDVDELDPHLAAFAKRGGKLLIYHGWADQQVAPGMAHCTGGEGPDTFDKICVLERWVEKGEAPERIVAAHSSAERPSPGRFRLESKRDERLK